MTWMDDLRRLLRRERGSAAGPAEHPATCGEALERVFEWLDGELDPASARRIGEHLELCARCYPQVRFERSFRDALDRACRCEQLPAEVEAGVMDALKEKGLERK
jgi:mycothiol system anti-sigma-R factor